MSTEHRPGLVSSLPHGLLRGIVVLALAGLVMWAMKAASGEDFGANIGAGLAGFLATVVLSLVGSVVDGLRRGLGWAVLTWVVAAVVMAIGFGAWALTAGSGTADEAGWSNVAGIATFMGGLVLVPGALGAALGGTIRSRQR